MWNFMKTFWKNFVDAVFKSLYRDKNKKPQPRPGTHRDNPTDTTK